MPRQPVDEAPSKQLGVMDDLMGEGEGVNFGDGESPVGPPPAAAPEPAVERTKDGEEIREGVVKRVQPPTVALRQEFTPEERAALEASQRAPVPKGPVQPDDLNEIPGLPFVTAMEHALLGIINRHGWEAVGEDQLSNIVTNFPRLYRTLRFVVNRGIYGDRGLHGVDAKQLRRMIG